MQNLVEFKKDDIVLVNPVDMGITWQAEEKKHYFPLNLLYLKNYLNKHNIQVSCIDLIPENLTPPEFKNKIKKMNPKIVGFTGDLFYRHQAFKYIKDLKKYVPNAVVVAGGSFFSAVAEDCLRHIQDIDVVCRGEGEITLYELVMAIKGGKTFHGIKGIVYRNEKGDIIENEKRPNGDRDSFEVDAKLIPNNDCYSPFVSYRNYEDENRFCLPILIARGCTNRCKFCYQIGIGRFNPREISSIVEEIKRKRELFNVNNFWFIDPTITLREAYTFELCRELIKHCPGIKWTCDARADSSLELLQIMAEAGCDSVAYALESGSPKVLKAINKELDVSRVVSYAKMSHELGMRGLVFVMYSLPTETMDDFYMTLDVLHKIKSYIYDIDIHQLLVFPGTGIEFDAKNRGLIPESFSWCDSAQQGVPVWQTLLTDRDIVECNGALTEFKQLLHAKEPLLREYIIHSRKFSNAVSDKDIFAAATHFEAMPSEHLSESDLLTVYTFAGMARDQKRETLAIKTYEKVIAYAAANSNLRALSYFHLSNIYYGLNDLVKAKDHLEICLDLMPKHKKARALIDQLMN